MRDYNIRPHIEGHDLVYGEEFRIPISLYKYLWRYGVSIHAEENLITGTGAHISIDSSLLGGDYTYSVNGFRNLMAWCSLDPEEVPRALTQEYHPIIKLILQWRLS